MQWNVTPSYSVNESSVPPDRDRGLLLRFAGFIQSITDVTTNCLKARGRARLIARCLFRHL